MPDGIAPHFTDHSPTGFPQTCGLRLFILAALLPLIGLAAEPPAATVRTLSVSAATDNYPYSYLDPEGHLTGYGVDMLDAVAETMSIRLERVEVPSTQDVDNLLAQRCDIGQFHTAPPEGPRAAEYSQPILIAHGEIFVRRGDKRFNSLADLQTRNARIATPQQGRDYLLAAGFDPDRIELTTSGGAITALSLGKVDAVLLTRLTGMTQAYYLDIHNVRPLGVPLSDYKVSYCIATRKGDQQLVEQINEALATLSTTGRTVEIYSRWFGRFETRGPTFREIIIPAAAVLALALVVTLFLLRRQHLLSRRIARQARELNLSREFLAEAQQFAHLGHFRRFHDPSVPAEWSDETFRIYEFPPEGGVPTIEQVVALAIPEDRPRLREALTATANGGPSYEFDITIDTPQGRRKTLNVRGRPTYDAANRQDGIFGTVQDVTASRAADAALKQSELLLRVLFENLPLALGLVERQDGKWVLLSLNPEAVRQLGLSHAPAVGIPIPALGLADTQLRFWTSKLDRCAKHATTLRFEFEAADQRKHFSAAIVPLILPGAPTRCCVFSEEITTRRLKDAELAQSRRLRAIGELVGGIAHEFNNLLTPVALNTEFLLGQCQDRPELRCELEVVADAARRASALTNRLLTFSRRTERRCEPVDLAAVVAANLALVRHTFDRRIKVVSRIPEGLPRLVLPTGDLQQIILNLMLNARDALADKLARPPSPDWSAHIEISATDLPADAINPVEPDRSTPNAGWVRITCRDNGCGMGPEVRERLFEPFFTTKSVGSGTGLGLAATWHLVTDFGGRIDVESTEGVGTAFHLSLPRTSVPVEIPPAPGEAASVSAKNPPLASKRFLLADDERSVALVLTRLLERSGHRVTTVSDGLSAWQRLQAEPTAFDAVIMDLNMPGLTGIELATRARALPFPGPLLVISGRISDDERNQLQDCGVDALIDKPFRIAALEATLAQAFAKSPNPPPAT